METSKAYTKPVYTDILSYCEKLEYLNVTVSSSFVYPSLSIRYLPSNTFSSSILTYLCINVRTFTDFVCLLDGRLKQLNTLIVQFYEMDNNSSVVHNLVSILYLFEFLKRSKIQSFIDFQKNDLLDFFVFSDLKKIFHDHLFALYRNMYEKAEKTNVYLTFKLQTR